MLTEREISFSLHLAEGKEMKLNKKLIAIPAIALAAGISLAACGSGTPNPHDTPVSSTNSYDGMQGVSAPDPEGGVPVATSMPVSVLPASSSPSPASPTAVASAPAAQKTLIRIHQSNLGGDETIYNNYWSDGTSTTCMVHVFADGTQSASGNCAPDGVASGMTVPAGGGAPAN